MTDILSTMQVVLREAGFSTYLNTIDRLSIVCFEDDVVTGFGYIFDDPESMLASWKSIETLFLANYAPSLRTAGEKAWNVYSVFLCRLPAIPEQMHQVHWIEENLERTRKIAACGVTSREDLIMSLLPILPLQYEPELQSEDVTERLRKRIQNISPRLMDIALDESVSAMEVIRLIGGPK